MDDASRTIPVVHFALIRGTRVILLTSPLDYRDAESVAQPSCDVAIGPCSTAVHKLRLQL